MKSAYLEITAGFLLLQISAAAAQDKKPVPPAPKPTKAVHELVREGNIQEALIRTSEPPGAREGVLKKLVEIADNEVLERQIEQAQSTLDNADKFLAACDPSGTQMSLLRESLRGRQSRLKGIKLSDSKDFQGAEAELRKALEISLKTKDRRLEAGVHNNLGAAVQGQGRLEDSVAEYEAAIRIGLEQKDFFRAGASSYNLGNLHIQRKQLPAALDTFKDAEKQLESAAKPLQQAHAVQMQAVTQDRMGVPDPEVIATFDRACKMFEQVGDIRSLGRCLYLLGDHLVRNQKYAEAAEHVERAVILLKAMKDEIGLQKCYELLADAYDKTGQKDKAENYRKMAGGKNGS